MSCGEQNPQTETLLSPGRETKWGLLRGDPSLGRTKAKSLCSGCHLVDGMGNTLPGAPPFVQTVAKNDVDAAFLKRWLADPQAMKPGTLMPMLGLSETDMEHIVAYLYHLRETAGEKQ